MNAYNIIQDKNSRKITNDTTLNGLLFLIVRYYKSYFNDFYQREVSLSEIERVLFL